jgi:lambda family phage portal protein
MATRRQPPKGAITTSLKPPKKFAMPTGARPSALRDPAFDYGMTPYGRQAYRDANPALWGNGGRAIFSPSSPNREINPSRASGVKNAREADRNQPLINAGISKRAANAVGANLRLQYLPNWEALGIDPNSDEAVSFVQTIENHFSLWGEDFRFLCDAQRQGQFGALMFLACRECFGAEGETLVIARYDEDRMVRYQGQYATFIEVVSVDRLSNPSDYALGDPNKPVIWMGKEVDEYGAAVAYHVETVHPSDSLTGERKWERIVRETDWGRPVGIHYFSRTRAGMQRAMPAIIQSLRTVKMLDRLDDAQLQSAIINAILSVYIESPGTTAEMIQKLTAGTPSGASDPLSNFFDKRFDYYENEDNSLTADGVRIPVLPPGDKISMEAVNRAADDPTDFRSSFLRVLAAQLNLTYEQFSGDYSKTTFSSARAAIIDIWRLVTLDRIFFTQHVAYPIFAAWLEECYVRADELGIDWPSTWPDFHENMAAFTQCEFRGPGMGWVDPQKDVTAAGLRVEQGLTSPTFEASQQGQDFRDNVDQTARDYAYARSKGVAIPGMPEYTAMQNPVPPADPNADPNASDGSNSGQDPSGSQPPANEDQARAEELERQENRL